jgi:hypothetical protein
MSTQIADAAASPPAASPSASSPPTAWPCGPADQPGSDAVLHDVHEPACPDQPEAVTRGIVFAILLSVPFWALLAFTLYLLI